MPKKTHPSRLIAGCHHPCPPRAGSHPWRDEARYAIAPETRKQIEPRQSGRHTSLLYSELVTAVCMAWKVVRLKKSVPADWITAAHHAVRPSPAECLRGHATQLCSAPPIVNRIQPTNNVIESAESPTRLAKPG